VKEVSWYSRIGSLLANGLSATGAVGSLSGACVTVGCTVVGEGISVGRVGTAVSSIFGTVSTLGIGLDCGGAVNCVAQLTTRNAMGRITKRLLKRKWGDLALPKK
jgi:hypothetical protein